MSKTKSFLKWPGGKFKLIERLTLNLPKGDVLVEPFVGAANVFLNTDYPGYVLCDVNKDLINLYKALAEHKEKFIEDCRELFDEQFNNKSAYLKMRTAFNLSDDPYERSVIFVYINRFGFNGLCRYNKSGNLNTPFGDGKPAYFPENEMRAFYLKCLSARVNFVHIDFATCFERYQGSGVVFYCDPPYVPLSPTACFAEYAQTGFSLREQQLLACLSKLSDSPVLVSNHDTELTRQLYNHYIIDSFDVQRNISCRGDKREKAKELLALFN